MSCKICWTQWVPHFGYVTSTTSPAQGTNCRACRTGSGLNSHGAMPTPKKPSYVDVDGIRLPGGFDPDRVREALSFKPKPGDIFLVTYPKCGTHWIQQISQLILNRGASASNYLEFQMKTPFLEFTGTSDLDAMPPPRLLKTHFAFDRQPYHEDAKYVYMVRNPRDCCVSFYHHSRCIPGYQFADGSFDDFFEVFIRGETDFGDYFDNLLSWYEHKDDPNVFFLTYEDLKKDTRGGVLRLARFFGKKYAEPLERDPHLLQQVLDKSSVQYMKDHIEVTSGDLEKLLSTGNGATMEPVRKMFVPRDGRDPTIQFIRKGQVGDWKGHFTPEQEAKMRARIAEKTAGTDVMSLWKDYCDKYQLRADKSSGRQSHVRERRRSLVALCSKPAQWHLYRMY
ncbi:sulfotransferase ssu-1 [Rhipicephalus sanguineus]|nr:sulfotransferase ssu-1 [Rhipicephalus sanguineus]